MENVKTLQILLFILLSLLLVMSISAYRLQSDVKELSTLMDDQQVIIQNQREVNEELVVQLYRSVELTKRATNSLERCTTLLERTQTTIPYRTI